MKTIDDIIKAKAKQAVEDAFQEFINSVVQMKDDKPKRVQKYCRICHKLECDCLIKSMEGMVIESSKDERLRELLKMAKCPDCDGSGTIVDEVIVTRVRSVLDEDGEQIGVPYPETEPELTPCQWCYERKIATKALNQ